MGKQDARTEERIYRGFISVTYSRSPQQLYITQNHSGRYAKPRLSLHAILSDEMRLAALVNAQGCPWTAMATARLRPKRSPVLSLQARLQIWHQLPSNPHLSLWPRKRLFSQFFRPSIRKALVGTPVPVPLAAQARTHLTQTPNTQHPYMPPA
jgi:hypothetical protein